MAASACGQSYGRFGGDGLPQPPGINVSVDGFRVTDAPSDTFQFLTPLADVKLVGRSDRHCEVSMRPSEGLPDAIRVNLRSPGFEMHVKGRIILKLNSLQSPLLTVEGVTFGSGVPTPASRWVLVSFQEPQPPLLLSVPESDGIGWQISGNSGSWTLTNQQDYEGWVRVCAPAGRSSLIEASGLPDSSPMNEQLGVFTPIIAQQGPLWAEPTSKLVGSSITRTGNTLQAIWTFDRPAAIIPPALLLCRTGGANVEVASGLIQANADLAEGPQGFSAEPRWVFRFPIRDLPPGRALVNGELPETAPDERKMLALLTSAGDPVMGKAQVLAAGDSLVGNGRAAFAEMAMGRWGWKRTVEGPTPVQKLLWSRDFASMTLYGDTPAAAATASAWLMLALSAHADPAMRLEGCLLWAGLTSQRVLTEYRRKRGLGAIELKKDVPLPDVLASAYGQDLETPSAGWQILNSPVRLLSGQRVVLTADVLEWRPVKGEGPVLLRAPLASTFEGVDGTALRVELSHELDWILRAVPGPNGRCRVKSKLPAVPDLR